MRISRAYKDSIVFAAVLLVCLCLLQEPAVAATAETGKGGQSAPKAMDVLDASNRAVTRHKLKVNGQTLSYTATAGSLTVSDKKSKPAGRIFYISYTANDRVGHARPLTFVFNGGPGAASAYLHMGALGPRRVEFGADGSVPPMPARLRDNAKSWLAFTDLVFVDPVGTGYSRELKGKADKAEEANVSALAHSSSGTRAWGVEEDVDSLARFIRAYLSNQQRWLSPLYLVGESYGGFRVARLSKLLQSDFGIAPSGLVLISPVLDFSMLRGSDRSLWPWVALLPSYSAVAAFHKRSDTIKYAAASPRVSLREVERVAVSAYLIGLADGDLNAAWLAQSGRLLGLDADTMQRWRGRVPPARFVKALLADQRRLVSLYDGSIALVDPEPAAQLLSGGDSYLERLNAPVTVAFNSHVRDDLDFKTDLPYLLLNDDVFESWNWRSGIQGQQGFVEAVADLKQALSLNTHMRVLIVHGVFDLVTPYYASVVAIKQMALDPAIEGNIQLKLYHGGHMPYLQQRSLDAMFHDAAAMFKADARSLSGLTDRSEGNTN